jgi:protein MpaA
VAGQSQGGLNIELFKLSDGPRTVLLIGGVHGDEPEGFLIAERILGDALFQKEIQAGICLLICPRLNPDGCRQNRRTNERNVDLNRNMPTRDWAGDFKNVRYYPGPSAGSEIETQILLGMLQAENPALIISLHSYEHAMINYNGDCLDLAEAMSQHNQLPPKGDIGYPTPGSLGTYGGHERNLPVITLEILRDQQHEAAWQQHRGGLLTAINFYAENAPPARKTI